MSNLKSTLLSNSKIIPLVIIAVAFLIRFVWITSVPPSPYWEEVALGYDAYSILQTGRDHHGNFLPLIAFESFGDFKPSLYFYSIVPFIALFGLNVLAVRLPSVIFGTLIVWISGKLAHAFAEELFPDWKKKQLLLLQCVVMFFAAVSPWGIIFSRGGWESNLATVLVLTGVWLGFKSWRLSTGNEFKLQFTSVSFRVFVFATVFFCLSMYAYHGSRLTAPLLGVLFVFPYLIKWKKNLKQILILLFIGLILLSPFLFALGSNELSQRFNETSIFSDISVIEESNQRIQEDGGGIVARIIHHRYLLFLQQIMNNAVSHFDLGFLFLHGDVNPRHSTQYFGHLLHLSFFPLIYGIYILFKQRKKRIILLLIGWTIAAILPASLTTVVPHSLRILAVSPLFFIVIGIGVAAGYYNLPSKFRWLVGVFMIFVTLEAFLFLFHYLRVYPVQYSSEWQYGYEEMITQLNQTKRVGEPVFITREYGRPAMYYWFYTQADPRLVQAEDQLVAQDQGEYLAFQNIRFVDVISSFETGLFASTLQKYEEVGGEKVSEVKDLAGKTVWVIYRR